MNIRRHITRSTPVCLAAATAMLVAACGGAQKPPVSGSNATAGNSRLPGVNDAYRFSACMRRHGVSNFQDPHVHVNGNQVSVMVHITPSISGSPNFKSAQTACAHLLPNGGNAPTPAQQHAREEAMLAFARCMRRHGFPRFPDPTAQGQLTLTMIRQAGIDLQQPAVRPAVYACVPLTHGLLSRADVNQASSSPNASGSQSGSGG